MALIKCPECSKDVSDKAPTCPNCGAPIAAASVDGGKGTARRGRVTQIGDSHAIKSTSRVAH